MLKAWLPVPTLTKTIVLFFAMGIIFTGVGIPMLILTNNIVEVTVNYDDTCLSTATNCPITFTIPQTMYEPVFVYYEMHNYYQNHRLYTKSVSYDQLKGNSISLSAVFLDLCRLNLIARLSSPTLISTSLLLLQEPR
jgi:hypothetical protein